MSFSLHCDLTGKAWNWEEGNPDSGLDSITNLIYNLSTLYVSTQERKLNFLICQMEAED